MWKENQLLHRRFSEVAQRYPSRFAVANEDGNLSLTYQELDERSTILAKALLESARDLLAENNFIGVMVGRGIGMVVALLAILKTGAAYVPVDPSFPKDRQAYIFSHSKCPLLIVDEGTHSEALTLAAAAEPGAKLPSMFTILRESGYPQDKNLYQGKSPLHEVSFPAPRDRPLGYVLYTSGSTGKPKGVMVYQDSVINIIDWFGNDIGMTIEDRVLGLTTYCFDISVLEMFMPLTRGSGLVVTTAATQKDPFRIVEVLQQMHITVMQATPTTFEMCLATGWKGDPKINFLVGGEAFRPKLKEIIYNCRSMRNVYGPTETTIWSSSYLFDPKNIPEATPIGKEISETQFYIVNEKMELMKDGEDGELCIGGLGVAKGYIHAPELTVARFIPNPFGPGKIYKTGDQARKLPDGNYVFMNRLDDQVKINGYRIELGEIESVIAQHSSVNQAVVLVRNDHLIGYVKPKYNIPEPSEQEIILFVSKKVPHYMVPSRVVCLTEFPQTANGKLDKKAFPDPVDNIIITKPTGGGGGTSHRASIRNSDMDGEETMDIAKFICLKVFNMTGKQTKTTDSLAIIGIDSLSSVFFRAKLMKTFDGISLGTKELFDPNATISSIAIKLQDKILKEKPNLLQQQLHFELYDPNDDLELQIERESEIKTDYHYHEINIEVQLLSNRLFLDGMRGLLAIWVFGDHFGAFRIGKRITSDTLLFLMISGLATSLQSIKLKSPLDMEESRGRVISKMSRLSSLSLVNKKTGDHFQWFNFLLYRWMALFPMYYLAIFVSIPRMIVEYPSHLANASQYTGCVIMYLLCLQTWTPWSRDILPDLFYTGVLWNIFLLYAAAKYIYYGMESNIWKYGLLSFLMIGLIVTAANEFSSRNPATMIPYFIIGMGYAWIFKECFAARHPEAARLNQVHPFFISFMNFWKRNPNVVKHFPDLFGLMILFLILMNWWGLYGTANTIYENVLASIFFPVMIGLQTCWCLLQEKQSRSFFTTYLCENWFVVLLGQCSYPMYIFQLIVVNYYMRLIFDHEQFTKGIAPSNFEYEYYWGHNQAVWLQCIAFVVVVSIAIFMQKIFQDIWVTRFFDYWRNYFPENAPTYVDSTRISLLRNVVTAAGSGNVDTADGDDHTTPLLTDSHLK